MGADIGLIGLAVMGENLVLNIESRGYSVSVFNRTVAKVDKFIENRCQGKQVVGCHTVEEFVNSLSSPRKIIIMVQAGAPVDATIQNLLPHLDKNDIILDCGNSFFMDTERRAVELEGQGIRFIGAGVSGGEEGALRGPAIMPGGNKKAYKEVENIFTDIAAKVEGGVCCTYMGERGAGHYVKMVHNGIEYGDMQLICEAYYLMKNVLGLEEKEMAAIFSEWNKGVLDSYLIEITADILGQVDDETGAPMVAVIRDTAGQKGTGKWTSQSALDLGCPAPTIAEAVFARCISAIKDERVAASEKLKGPRSSFKGNTDKFIKDIHDALYASKICSYAQGFALMQAASKEYDYNLNFKEIPMVFRGGCIIRAVFLDHIRNAYKRKGLKNLMMAPYFKSAVRRCQPGWRRVV
ncbi:MAG: NADP-dependent phosphogluconate dehydrogenase, partial [Planctomycetes bacterium]|nr:NADP-dependent phosphogluconate dehydrogenase [Planctomycetota bacterium]